MKASGFIYGQPQQSCRMRRDNFLSMLLLTSGVARRCGRGFVGVSNEVRKCGRLDKSTCSLFFAFIIAFVRDRHICFARRFANSFFTRLPIRCLAR